MRVNGRAVLATLVLVLVSVSAVTFSYATLYPSLATDALGNSGSAEIGLNVKEFIKLAVDTNNLALKDEDNNTIITPTTSGTLISGDVNLAVTTNTEKGYSLSVYTADNTKAMSHSNSGIEASIAPIDTAPGYNATNGISALANNTWGFRKLLDTNTNTGEKTYSNWYSIGSNSTNGTIIDSTDSDDSLYCDNLAYPLENTGCLPSSYNTYEVNFGAKLTNSLPAGTYANNVVFSAVAKSEGIKYRLIFNPNPTGANGGSGSGGITGSMSPKTILAGSTTTLPKGTFEKEGKGIKGWALVDNATLSTTPIYDINSTVQVDTILADAETAGQTPDTNNNEINLYAVWDTAYTLEFQYGAEDVEGTPFTGTTIKSNNLTFPEYTAFSKEGYTQIGWALVENATAETTPLFEENQTISISNLITAAQNAGQSVSPTSASKIVLYGVWEKDIAYFQTFNSCATIPEGETGILKDSRDDQEYTVYRFPTTGAAGTDYPTDLAGYCIMTQDLSLGYVTGGSVTKGDNLILTTADSADAGTIMARTSASASDWSQSDDVSNLQYINGPYSGKEEYSSHSYYSYGAAQKICPKSWRPPTNIEYGNIATFMGGRNSTGSTNIRNVPYNFVYGGVLTNAWSSFGSRGYYWASDQYSYNRGYYLDITSDDLATYYQNNHYGMSVRCIIESYNETVSGYMQDYDTSSIAQNETITLADKRDKSTYTVKRLVDGKVWMTQNLRYVGTTTDPGTTSYTSGSFSTDATLSQGAGTITRRANAGGVSDSFILYSIYNGNTTYGAQYSGMAAQIVCPANWHIPIGGTNGTYEESDSEFRALDRALGFGGTLRRYDDDPIVLTTYQRTDGGYPGFVLSGEWNPHSDYGTMQGTNYITLWGSYPGSLNGRSDLAWWAFIYNGRTDLAGQNMYCGDSVRCIAN